ncbi:MAG: serine--tRNA ligase [Acholeplasmatales bacterium]|nr:MAG: serine--tRNA ligase [Acholeplasmatales bacterium]
MIDIKKLREQPDALIARLNTRGTSFEPLRAVLVLDEKRRTCLAEVQTLQARRNEISRTIGKLKRAGADPAEVFKQLEDDKARIQALEETIRTLELEIESVLLNTPNLPHVDIPLGSDETENVVLREEGDKTMLKTTPKAHWDIAAELGLLDFERAAKIATSRFVIYKNHGARLERALINFMLDLHRDAHGYEEVMLPYIVNEASMFASGQFPKFREDAFKLQDERNLYLNPTAEVPAINMHRDEILDGADLPRRYAAFTTAFRQEAGSAGRDTRGIIRQHQFNKVELIKFTTPETSYAELDAMLQDSENVLIKLGLPYRVIELCSGDIGFAMAKTYDIEVWLPSYGTYREIGSISNAEDYQARRGNIRFRREPGGKPELVHTLNGSGLAVGRTVVAILENYLQEDGTVKVPEALVPYMKTNTIK